MPPQPYQRGHLSDRFGLAALLNYVHDIDLHNRASPSINRATVTKAEKAQSNTVGLYIEAQGHLLRIHHSKAEKLPQSQGQRAAQSGSGNAGARAIAASSFIICLFS